MVTMKTHDAEPRHSAAFALHERGLHLLRDNQAARALPELERAVELDPRSAEYLKSLGNAQKAMGNLQGAMASYRSSLEIAPDYTPSRYNLGLVLCDLNRPLEAEQQFRLIHEKDPRDTEVLFQLALLLAARQQFSESVQLYRSALALTPDDPHLWFHLGMTYRGMPGQAAAAVECLRKCVGLKPDFVDALHLLGDLLQDHGQVDQAVTHYRNAIGLAPDNARLHGSLGDALLRKHSLTEAIGAYCKAIELAPDLAFAHFNLGCAYGQVGAYDKALTCYETVLQLRPDDAGARGLLLFDMQRTCDWSRFEELSKQLRSSIVGQPDREIHPFGLLSIPSTPAEQLQCARNYVAIRQRAVAHDRERLCFRFERRAKSRLSIGYLSADFREHPVARLIAEMFELHDRGRFEIAGYSYGPDDASPMRERLARSFDRFVDISSMSHADAAARIHGDQVDILVDLTGYTAYNRTEIAALKPAPVQVSFLGYPGSLGADFIDYVITDRFITLPGRETDLCETPVFMPGSYQVNDRKRAVAEMPRRTELGLPEDALVYCCFNHTFKILPHVFAVWMRLLKAVPRSVLWVLESNRWAAANLRREARARGVDPERLVFAPQYPQERHLGRMRAADLFLDTLPYNAHTTASDALWVGLPVLTCAGDTFASRVAGSLLTAVGMPELITNSLEEYEAMALGLARNPGQLTALREKLARNRTSAPLFDTPVFARHLETAYSRMWENHLAGNEPRAILL